MTFKPGQSGNPNGRRKIDKDLQELMRQHTPAAINALVAALKQPRERVAAAVALLDRAYGKPSQTLDVNHSGLASEARDEALLAIALSSRRNGAASADDTSGSDGMVH
jgi:hypothetical protein